MKIWVLILIVLSSSPSLARCDTCVVRPNHQKYLAINAMGKLFLNPYSDFATSGISSEYQRPNGLRYGIDVITSNSLSNISNETPFRFAVSPTLGIKYSEWKRLTLYQKNSIGLSNGNESLFNSREQSIEQKNITRTIASTEIVVSCRLGSSYRFRSPTISYSIGFAADLGVVPFLSEANNYGYQYRQSSIYSGFYTGIALGFNLYGKKSSGVVF